MYVQSFCCIHNWMSGSTGALPESWAVSPFRVAFNWAIFQDTASEHNKRRGFLFTPFPQATLPINYFPPTKGIWIFLPCCFWALLLNASPKEGQPWASLCLTQTWANWYLPWITELTGLPSELFNALATLLTYSKKINTACCTCPFPIKTLLGFRFSAKVTSCKNLGEFVSVAEHMTENQLGFFKLADLWLDH